MASSFVLSSYLNNIVASKITLNEEERVQNVQIVNDIVSVLVNGMKVEDRLFAELYQKIVFTGSYYEELKIKNSYEFDLNLVLKLPFRPEDISIRHYPDPTDFVEFHLNGPADQLLMHMLNWPMVVQQKLKSFFENGSLMRNEVQNWMHSVIKKALNHFTCPNTVSKIQFSQSGPAFTLHIIRTNGRQIDVDLVPVIDGSNVQKSIGGDVPYPLCFTKTTRFNRLTPQERVFYLVPKTTRIARSQDGGRVLPSSEKFWRVSFPLAEKQLIHDIGAVKLLIKLFKLLRDRYWPFISSYQIKTMFMWEIEKNPNPSYWHQAYLETRFMEMLLIMKCIFESKLLRYYFSPNANLLADFHPAATQNVVGGLNTIIRGLKNNPQNIYQYMQ